MLGRGPTSGNNIVDLRERIARRQTIVQPRAQAQIPEAEAEADKLSASVTSGTPESVKAEMGARMGADFSGVRFHTDAAAAAKADSMEARAFTSGSDVYFNEGGFDPSIAAHELVHTAQQGMVGSGVSTMSTPAGGVQRFSLSESLRRFGGKVRDSHIGRAVSSIAGKIRGSRVGRAASAVGRGLKRVGGAIKGMVKKASYGLSTAGTAVKEFVGGKLGLVGKPSSDEKKENYQRALGGDYSMAARMSKDAQNEMTARQTNRIAEDLSDDRLTGDLSGDEDLATKAIDPFYRKALSLTAKSNTEMGDRAKAAQENIDQQMMINTMLAPSDADKERLRAHYRNYDDQELLRREYALAREGKTYLGEEADKASGQNGEQARAEHERLLAEREAGNVRSEDEVNALADADLAHAQESGDALLRTMFMMQLGKFESTTKDGDGNKVNSEWDKTMANAFAHGGRTAFVLSGGEDGESSSRVNEAVFQNALSGRASATHYLAMPDADSRTNKGLKEVGGIKGAVKSAMHRDFHHFGMNMAIGGIGRKGGMGPDGPMMINAQGRNGHMYVGQSESSNDKKGGLLMGLESDSPYRMNQTGHMHNAAAMAEEGSSTGGLKTDITGEKYGGRTVDMSGLKNSELASTVNDFSAYFTNLRNNDADAYKQLVTQITGRRMTEDQLFALMSQMGANNEGDPEERERMLRDRIRRARGGAAMAQ